MSWERDADEVAGRAGAVSGVLASDADRDAVASLLSEAFAEGRLSAGEHGERVRAAYAARTWAELSRLTTDLPVPAGDAAGRPAAGPYGLDRCLLCALLLCPPAGIAWLLAARRRPRPSRGRTWRCARRLLGLGSLPGRKPETCRGRDRRRGCRPGSGRRPVMPGADGMSHSRGAPRGEGGGLAWAVAPQTGRRALEGGGARAEDR